jgi:pyruvate carboxylase
MRVALDAVVESGKLCEAAICYTGDINDPERAKYDLKYYVALAKELEAAGAHILGIKDMAGLLKPQATATLVRTLKQEIGLPIHLHTHDTSGISAASVLAAVDAGVDAVDAAIDSFSGLTSQPNLGSIVEALRAGERDSGLDPAQIRVLSDYWEAVRFQYRAFESDIRAGASEVYLHEMPGGQFTNLKEQARALGLENRWHEVAQAYADVNRMFGDIVKVTPSSKVVGDMALMMVSSGLTPEDVTAEDREIAFPESVVSMFRGELGLPPGGWPVDLQRKVLKGEAPLVGRPGASMEPVDLAGERAQIEKQAERQVSDNELASYLMYPAVFTDYAKQRREFGRLDVLPTPVFFYGMAPGDEIAVDIDPGKTLAILCMAIGEPHANGEREVFFELNGQPRIVRVIDRSLAPKTKASEKAEEGNPNHVAAPMPGMITTVTVSEGQTVQAGDVLLSIEAMKLESAVHAEFDAVVERLVVKPGARVEPKDLLLVLTPV